MDPVFTIPAIAIGCLLVGAFGMHKLSGASTVPKVEATAFEGVVDGVAALLDTAAEDRAITAAQARKATKAAAAKHLSEVLAAKALQGQA